ncbi:MAG TPA: formate dehydrogenase subunit gamma [Candidatus Binataceae bacterium]
MNPLVPWSKEAIDAIIARFVREPGALMLVLHEMQDTFGCIPPESIAVIAAGLNLSRAEVHGVVTFYRDFRRERPGRHTIAVCRAESCQAMGGNALAEHIKTRLGIDFGRTSADGSFTLEPVYCLGNCACSPAVMIDHELRGRVSPAGFDAICERLRKS